MNADAVSRHLVMAGRLLDEDPEPPTRHAVAARDRAGRVGGGPGGRRPRGLPHRPVRRGAGRAARGPPDVRRPGHAAGDGRLRARPRPAGEGAGLAGSARGRDSWTPPVGPRWKRVTPGRGGPLRTFWATISTTHRRDTRARGLGRLMAQDARRRRSRAAPGVAPAVHRPGGRAARAAARAPGSRPAQVRAGRRVPAPDALDSGRPSGSGSGRPHGQSALARPRSGREASAAAGPARSRRHRAHGPRLARRATRRRPAAPAGPFRARAR